MTFFLTQKRNRPAERRWCSRFRRRILNSLLAVDSNVMAAALSAFVAMSQDDSVIQEIWLYMEYGENCSRDPVHCTVESIS